MIAILEGDPEITLGDETRTLGPGGVVFVPAGTPHRTRNVTTSPVRIHAMFPSERIGIEYLERNPAPGTEDDPPQPAVVIDVRALEHIARAWSGTESPAWAGLSSLPRSGFVSVATRRSSSPRSYRAPGT